MSHSYDVWVGAVGVVRKWSSQTQLFQILKLSSAPPPLHFIVMGMWTVRRHGSVHVNIITPPVSPSLHLPLRFLPCAYFHWLQCSPSLPGWCFTNSGSGHWLSLFQPEHQKRNHRSAEIAWREGPALGCEWHISWAADECQRCLPPTLHLTGRPVGKSLLCDSIIKQAHPGSSSLANTKETQKRGLWPLFGTQAFTTVLSPARFLYPPGGSLFAVKLLRAGGERICSCTCPFLRSVSKS